MIKTWRLDGATSTYVLASENDRLPEVLYWGASLPKGESLVALWRAGMSDVTGGMLDQRPVMTICPMVEDVFPGQLGVDLDGYHSLRLHDVVESEDSLVLTFTDGPITYTMTAHMDAANDVLALTARMTGTPIRWLSAPAFPAPSHSDHLVGYGGKWIGEFQANNIPWTTGAHVREVRDGRTSHEAFPGILIPCNGASHTQGEVYAAHLGQSSGHRMVAEQLPDGRRQVMFGPVLGGASDDVTAGPLFLTRSGEGRNGIAHRFHAHFRQHIEVFADPNRPRPVHYNCWEAVYFDHDIPELQNIATRAAALGAERFVLDDGWFGKRNDDTTSLGDWDIDPAKYPDGLSPLIDHIHGVGMTFGIWFEPEMVNPISKLFEAHPDWILGAADQPLGRGQLVLNMALPEVCEYLFEKIDAVLSAYDIDYIKWDHNRVLPFPDHRQAAATYALIDRLRAAHPGVEIESCSSGGGRIDWGILKRTSRVWLSDSNDALERMRIQAEAMPFIPPEITGSHVGPRVCHTSGRIFPMELRAWVAAQRCFGFEMNTLELTEAESNTLRRVTDWWKDNRDWMHTGRQHRLDLRDPEQFGEMTVSADGKRFACWLGQRGAPADIISDKIRLAGLLPELNYKVTRVSHYDGGWLSRGDNALKQDGVQLSGAGLMQFGLQPPILTPAGIIVFEGTAQ